MTTCLPNIGPRQRKRRVIGGMVMLVVTVLVATWLVMADARWFWRLLIALPAGASALGFFQAQARTCVALARQGVRNMDAGNESVSEADLARHRRQARQVYLRASFAAIVVALLMLAF